MVCHVVSRLWLRKKKLESKTRVVELIMIRGFVDWTEYGAGEGEEQEKERGGEQEGEGVCGGELLTYPAEQREKVAHRHSGVKGRRRDECKVQLQITSNPTAISTISWTLDARMLGCRMLGWSDGRMVGCVECCRGKDMWGFPPSKINPPSPVSPPNRNGALSPGLSVLCGQNKTYHLPRPYRTVH